ncbi:hypothetical protein [Dongia sp.]|uniref:hypothetical protein n=1 Tax=Dongia sp. TaxID=1977262 RepID=UPI003753251A
MARLAIEYWKLLRAFERTLDRVAEEHRSKTAAQLKFSASRLDSLTREGGISLATFEGQAFSPNLPVTAVNGEDFEDGAALIIESTLEPAVVQGTRVIAMGKVTLVKGEDHVSRD